MSLRTEWMSASHTHTAVEQRGTELGEDTVTMECAVSMICDSMVVIEGNPGDMRDIAATFSLAAGLRPWIATVKHGRTTHEITGMAPTLERAEEIIRHEFGALLGSTHRYIGVRWDIEKEETQNEQ